MGYSPWGHKRIKHSWATKQTKRLPFNFILSSERKIQNVILVWLNILELFSKENKLQRNEYVLRLPIAKVHLELFFFIFEEGLKFNSKRLYDGQSKRRRGDKVNPDIIHSLFTRTQCSDLKYSPPTLTCHWKENVCCTAGEILVLLTSNHILSEALDKEKYNLYPIWPHAFYFHSITIIFSNVSFKHFKVFLLGISQMVH